MEPRGSTVQVDQPGPGCIFETPDPEPATQVITELFESNYQMLVRYSFRAAHDRNVAEDVVQQALLMLYKSIRRGILIDNPKAWVFCVIRRLISKHVRVERLRAALNEPLTALDGPATRVVRASEAGFELEDVTKLYSVLSPREKEVVLLRMTSLKYREIADRLGISPKSVNTLLARGLRKLQRAAGAKSTPGFEDLSPIDKKTLH